MSNLSNRQPDAFDNPAKMACCTGNLRVRCEGGYRCSCQPATMKPKPRTGNDDYRAVQRVRGSGCRALGPYEALKELGPVGWSKSDNWRIAKEMTPDDLEGTDLGNFLARL